MKQDGNQRRQFIAAAAAGSAGALAAPITASAQAANSQTAAKAAPGSGTSDKRKTYVLLHGAWHGGWCWTRVSEPLAALGHRVYTPTQTGVGERSHLLSKDITLETFATDLINVLLWEDLRDVILVGHSFGGNAISAAADRIPERIRHLVYLDAVTPANGKSTFDTLPAELVAARRKLAQESSQGLTLPVPDPKAFGVTDADDTAWLLAKCTPHPLATYETSLTLKNQLGNGIAATYIAVKPDYGPLAGARAYAKKRSDWRYLEIDAGHDAMVTSPKAVLEILQAI